MDSHGSAPSTPSPASSGTASRSAGGDVTRRRQTDQHISGFRAVEQLRIEDLLALAEQIGRSATCACSKAIVQLGTGVWRSDENPFGGDRIACAVQKRHQPQETPGDEIPFRTGEPLS